MAFDSLILFLKILLKNCQTNVLKKKKERKSKSKKERKKQEVEWEIMFLI